MAAIATLAPTTAGAVEQHAPSEIPFFVALAILVIVGRLAGEAMQRIGQPAVMGQLIAGLILGPTVFGAVLPDLQREIFGTGGAQAAMLNAVSQLGILMLLLLTGMETDLGLVRKIGRAAACVSVGGIAIPFVCGVALGQALPDSMLGDPSRRVVTSLFLGTALSISSVKIVAMVVREMDFLRRNLGQVIVASSIIDDTIGWVIIAVTFSLASKGEVDLASVALRLGGAAAFLVFSFTIGRRIIFTLIRWSNDHLVSDMPVISLIIALTLLMALATHLMGLHTVLGAFVCGILVGESPILTRHIEQQLRGLIMGLFMPVFFATAGLSADLRVLADPKSLGFTAAFVLIASLGKSAGAFIGGKAGGLTFRECVAIACGMNARGSTEVIVATIGLSLGMLTHDLFTMIVTMAVITTLIMPPTLRWALARVPMSEEEKQRIEKETFETRGFVTNLERILVAIDDSANGRLASRLAGLVAGSRAISTTVLRIGRAEPGEPETAPAEEAGEVIKSAAKEAGSEQPETPHVTTRTSADDPKHAISAEAQRGYDLLVLGLDEPVSESGAFRARVSRAAGGFEGATAVLIGRGVHLQHPEEAPLNILIPMDRKDTSSRAAEIALCAGRGSPYPVSVIHISAQPTVTDALQNALRSRIQEETLLKTVTHTADHFGVTIKTSLQSSAAPGAAIVQKIKRDGHNLVVLGAQRRTGEALDLGDLPRQIVAETDASVLIVRT